MGRPLTYQDDLDLYWIPGSDGVADITAIDIDEMTHVDTHQFQEVMADGFNPNATQNVVAEEMLVGGKLASTIGSESYQPSITVRRLDADNDDLDALDRGEVGFLVAVPKGSTIAVGDPYDAYLVTSAGPAGQNSQANAYQKMDISLPAEDWAINASFVDES